MSTVLFSTKTDKRNSQQAPLQSQSHRCFWVNDNPARAWDIDIENGLSVDFPGRGFRTEGRGKPGFVSEMLRSSRFDFLRAEDATYHTVATPCSGDVKTGEC
jgi:hypothetical protein